MRAQPSHSCECPHSKRTYRGADRHKMHSRSTDWFAGRAAGKCELASCCRRSLAAHTDILLARFGFIRAIPTVCTSCATSLGHFDLLSVKAETSFESTSHLPVICPQELLRPLHFRLQTHRTCLLPLRIVRVYISVRACDCCHCGEV